MAQAPPNTNTIAANATTVKLGDGSAKFASRIAVQITGTWVGTIEFRCNVDGATDVTINAQKPDATSGATTTTGNGVFLIDATGLTDVKAVSTAWTSGTATLTWRPVEG